MAEVFSCPECNEEVLEGSQVCEKCQTELTWKDGKEKGSYYIQLTNSEQHKVPYNVECVIYDSIDR